MTYMVANVAVQPNYYSNRVWNPNGVVPVGPIPSIEELAEKGKEGWSELGWKGFDE
jgi:hypothetical protein